MVPDFFSSEKSLMVRSGTMRSRITLIFPKSGLTTVSVILRRPTCFASIGLTVA